MKPIEPEHKCQARFTDAGEQFFPVAWIRADSLDPARLLRRTAKKLSIGVCGFSHRPFKVASGPLEVLVFHDLAIVKGRCEEEGRCLAQQCPLNRTPDSMLKTLLGTRDRATRSKIREQLRPFTEARYCGLFKQDEYAGGIVLPPQSDPKQPPTFSG